ncbi:MAG: VOC family protein [Vicinamibacterales bacterium]|nr:VOC family protein [Vicinamibacterales bacterium]
MKKGTMDRRTLLQTLGVAVVGAPFAASLETTAFAQGGCRDGYAQPQGRCTLTKEVATAPIKPVFEPTGWRTVGLDHLTFEVADYRKEAAFYMALMGWTLRSDDGKQAILDMGQWGSTIFKQVPGETAVRSFAWAIDPWNAKTVEAELRKRGMTPVAENRGTFQSFHVKDPDGWDLQICNGEGLVKARKTPSTAKLSEPAPFAPTGWTTVWLDHLSFGVTNYKESVSFYSNLLGWQGSYDEGTQNEVMIGDIGDAIIRGGNPNDPSFAVAPARRALIDHISFGISPWDVDGVRQEIEKRGLPVSVDTSSAHPGPDGKMVSDDIHQAAFQSYHTRTPGGYNLQISWMTRDKRLALANAVKPKALPLR